MDLKSAQNAFMEIMQQVPEEESRKSLFSWIDENWMRGSPSGVDQPMKQNPPSPYLMDYNSCDGTLRAIANDIRELLPLNGILPSEKITFPTVGENSDCDPLHTLHVDAFLFDEDLVDELCDTGDLARSYCVACGSHNTQPITYLSHSVSRERLAYIFRALLPPIPEDAVLVDIGSRLGAVLYGAYTYTKCKKIVGIEMNSDLCQVQQTLVNKYQFQDRIQVVAGDVQEHSKIVQVADVILLNNVFEFFVPIPVQIQIWKFLRATTKKGSLIVSMPSLKESLQHLEVGFSVDEWVREYAPHDPNLTAPFDFQSEISEVKLYQVL